MRKHGILFRENHPPEHCKFLSLCIPMSFTHLSNVARDKDFINKSVRLSHDLICKILISPPPPLLAVHVSKIILDEYVLCN
jgi:hypothetical protein